MKQSFLLGLIMLASFLSIRAQESLPEPTAVAVEETKPSLLPNAKDWGVTVNVMGLISNIQLVPRTDLLNNNSILIRYAQSDRWTYRIGFSPQIFRFNVTTTDSVGKDLVEFDSTASRSNVAFRPGVEYHFKGSRRLDPYIALDGEFGIVGGMKIGSVTNTTDTTGTSRVTRTITEDGGFSVGAKLSVGMNYFVAERFCVGMEYGLGLTNIVSGGDRQEVIQIEPVSGTNTTLRNLSSSRTSDLHFQFDPMVQITLGYFFAQ
ncbi:MAG: hypothetical protein HQ500_07290 [Flavobacteriales bacterium]|nr:hypothetical protein [Flavobacteriales bacterium]